MLLLGAIMLFQNIAGSVGTDCAQNHNIISSLGNVDQRGTVSDCSSIYTYDNRGWTGTEQGTFNLVFPSGANGWTCTVQFSNAVTSINTYDGQNEDCNGDVCTFDNESWNTNVAVGGNVASGFTMSYAEPRPNIISIKINGEDICTAVPPTVTTTTSEPTTTTPEPTTTTPEPTTTTSDFVTTTQVGSGITDCSSFYTYDNRGWTGIEQGTFNLVFPSGANGWTCTVQFSHAVTSIDTYDGQNEDCNGDVCTFVNESWNTNVPVGGNVASGFTMSYAEPRPNIISIKINGEDICTGVGTCPNAKYPYAAVLGDSLLFYEAQRSGPLPADQRVTWRKDSALQDGQDVGLDLVGGYYDAADYVKFNFPQASALTVLSWGGITWQDGYASAGQLVYLRQAVKWGTDYLIKCHVEPNVYYVQVGSGDIDHLYWGRPEDMTMERPSHKLDATSPGSDAAGEAAAALASAAILFQSADPDYAAEMLSHAVELFNFAETYKGKYSDSIVGDSINDYYPSYSYTDELAWAAAWLYKATGNSLYLDKAKSYANELGDPAEFSWDDKNAGVFLLLAQLTGDAIWTNKVQTFCDYIVDTVQRSPLGLAFISEFGSLRYAANAAMICLMGADIGIESEKYIEFAVQQLNYILGDTGRSFVNGFGTNPPRRSQHASSNCPPSPAPCDWENFEDPGPNYFVLTGAMVGGPQLPDDQFVDDRSNYKTNEVTLDYNAGFQSLLAGVVEKVCLG